MKTALLRVVFALVFCLAGARFVHAEGVDVEKVAVVTPGAITNLGWDQQAADGLNAVAAELGFEALVAEMVAADLAVMRQEARDVHAEPVRGRAKLA